MTSSYHLKLYEIVGRVYGTKMKKGIEHRVIIGDRLECGHQYIYADHTHGGGYTKAARRHCKQCEVRT